MKRTLATTAIAVALAAVTAAPAFADPGRGRGHDRDHRERSWDRDRRGPPDHAPAWGRRDRDHHRWSRGQRLPSSYYGQSRYYVNNYRTYRLPPPPPGYAYVRVDGDVYLAQTRTGLIANVIANLF